MNRTREQYKEEVEKIQDKWFEEWRALGKETKPSWRYEDEQTKVRKDWYKSLEVGDRVHIKMYSDIEPATVIKRTPKMLVVRYDKAERDPSWQPEWITGGFAGHCTNQDEQKWIITEDPNGVTERFNWSEKYGVWKNKADEYALPDWDKYYDYNF